MIKLYPSSSAFMKGASAETLYNSACPRFIMVEKLNEVPKGSIPEIYSQVAAIDEARFFEVLKKRHTKVEREVPIRKELVNDKIILSGRRDFVADGWVYEKKSSINTRKAGDLKKGKVNLNQLAQLVTYMLMGEHVNGALVVTVYQFNKDLTALEVKYEREFIVSIEDTGAILLDGSPLTHTVDDIRRFYKTLVKGLVDREVPPMPQNWTSKYGSPCNFCPIKEKCLEYELKGLDRESFLLDSGEELARARLSDDPKPEPFIHVPKR